MSGVRRRKSGNVRSLRGHFSGLVFHRPHGKRVLRNAFLIRLEPVGWQRPAAQGFFHVCLIDSTDESRTNPDAEHLQRARLGKRHRHFTARHHHHSEEIGEHGSARMERARRNRP